MQKHVAIVSSTAVYYSAAGMLQTKLVSCQIEIELLEINDLYHDCFQMFF